MCSIIKLPLGFADWRVSTALITGFMAKESVVSTLTILFGSSAALGAALSPAAAAPLLVFCLLYTPCIAAVASVKRELGGRWAAVMVLNQCVVAWVAAFIVRMLALAALLAHFFLFLVRVIEQDRKSTRLNSSHITRSRMPSSA